MERTQRNINDSKFPLANLSFHVRRGKALLSGGREARLTTVVPISSDQSDLWR